MNSTSMEGKRTSFDICLLDQNGLGNRDAVISYKEPSEKNLYRVEPQELEKQLKKTDKEYEPCEGSQCEEGKTCEEEDLQQKDPTEEQDEEPTEDELSEGSIAWLSSESDNEDQHWSISAQSISEEKKRRLFKILSFANHLSTRKQWSPLDQSSPYKFDSEDGTAMARTPTTPFVNSTSMREQSSFVCQLGEDDSGSETIEKEQLYKREPMEEPQCVSQPKKEQRPPKGGPDEEGTPYEVEIRKKEATEEHNEELTGDVPSKECIAWLSPETNCELNCRSNSSVSSSEKKRRSLPMLDAHAKKRLKQDTEEISLKDTQKSGSSGKRRLDKQEAEPEAEGCNMAKKRRTGWTIDDTQLKILGPLKLPDLVKGGVSATEPDPHIVKLNSQLLEINRKLMFQEPIDDLAEDELSPSPPPIYNDRGIRVNTRVARLRRKLSDRRQKIVSALVRTDPIFKASPEYKPQKFFKKLYIPVEQYPGYNFIGLIIGPRGLTQKAMEKETGARIILRGKGSCKSERAQQHKDVTTEFLEDDDLHVYLEADSQESLDAAVKIVENLLVPVEEGRNKHKHAQLRELAELTSSKIQRTVSKPNASCPCPTVYTPEGCSHGGLFSSGCPVVGNAEEIDKAKLFVCVLPKSINDDGLRRLFVPFGPLCEAVVVKDKITGSSKGYGFVKYTSPRFAAEAVARMNGYRIDGKILVVRVASRSSPTANVARHSRGLPGIGHLQTTPVNPSMTCAIMGNENISPSWPLPPVALRLLPQEQ